MIKSFDVPVKWHEFSYVNKRHKKSNYSVTFGVDPDEVCCSIVRY